MKYVKIKISSKVEDMMIKEQLKYVDELYHKNKHKAKEEPKRDRQWVWLMVAVGIALIEIAVAIPAVILLMR